MCDEDEILDTEFLIVRIPPRPDMTTPLTGGGKRASSNALDPRKNLKKSCSRVNKTSPLELLQLNADDYPDNWREWLIGVIRTRDVKGGGFEIEICPTDTDAGHCDLVLPNAETFTPSARKKRWSKLAKRTRVLDPDEIETGVIREF